jgi:hypothetical protein
VRVIRIGEVNIWLRFCSVQVASPNKILRVCHVNERVLKANAEEVISTWAWRFLEDSRHGQGADRNCENCRRFGCYQLELALMYHDQGH